MLDRHVRAARAEQAHHALDGLSGVDAEYVNINVCVDGWCRTATYDQTTVEVIDTEEGRRVVARAAWDEQNELDVRLRYAR